MRVSVVSLVVLSLGWSGLSAFAQNLTTLATFTGANGDLPYGTLIADPVGNLYGTTYYGGLYGYGTIFQVSAGTHVLTTLYSFDAADGANPQAGLTCGADGNLYGTTVGGGTNHGGTAFEFSLATHRLTTLASFDPATTGDTPIAGLTLGTDGNLYGATSIGGAKNGGVVFKIDGSTHTLAIITSFGVTASNEPLRPSAPIFGANGDLWGVTAGGGANDDGTVYKIDAGGHTLTTAASLNFGTGPGNSVALVTIGDGNLYGTTGGGVFKFDLSTNAVSTIAILNGSAIEGGLASGADGFLYGTTYLGGASNVGSIFRLDPASDTLTTLASFDGSDGAGPFAGLLVGPDGNLYGTTTGGDLHAYGLGTVFELAVPEPVGALCLCVTIFGLIQRRTEVRSK